MPERTDVEKNRTLKGVLYLVGTPIGNLADISERALKVLSESDFIAAEDTRNSLRLLTHFDIHKPMVSYFEHNKRERGEEIVALLKGGSSVALVTDAGTPAISDPGEDLLALCAEEGIKVTSIPGCCAAINALALSALPTGRFVFEGFLPMNKSERKERLSEISAEKRTLILYEAPHKLRNTLKDLCEHFGEDRRITLCREMTKLNEELIHMGAACEEIIAMASDALTEWDEELVGNVKRIGAQIDESERTIENICMKLLLRQQPVARDLRCISAAMKMITDMERIGDQAEDIVEIVPFMTRHPDEKYPKIREMARETMRMVTEAVDAYVKQDLTLAQTVMQHDDVVDDYFTQVKRDIISMIAENPNGGEYALDLLMIAKYFERIGDHCTNIAEWVVFSVTGEHKECQ